MGIHWLCSHIHIQSGANNPGWHCKEPSAMCTTESTSTIVNHFISFIWLGLTWRQVDLHTVENIEEWDHNGFWFLSSPLFEWKGYKLYIPKIASSSNYYTPVSLCSIMSRPLPMYMFFSHHDSEDLHMPRVAVHSPAYQFLMDFLSSIFSSARSLFLKTKAAGTSLSNSLKQALWSMKYANNSCPAPNSTIQRVFHLLCASILWHPGIPMFSRQHSACE